MNIKRGRRSSRACAYVDPCSRCSEAGIDNFRGLHAVPHALRVFVRRPAPRSTCDSLGQLVIRERERFARGSAASSFPAVSLVPLPLRRAAPFFPFAPMRFQFYAPARVTHTGAKRKTKPSGGAERLNAFAPCTRNLLTWDASTWLIFRTPRCVGIQMADRVSAANDSTTSPRSSGTRGGEVR